MESSTSQHVELELKQALNLDQGFVTSLAVSAEAVPSTTSIAAKSQSTEASCASSIPVEKTHGHISQLQPKSSSSNPIKNLQSNSAEVISSASSESLTSPRNLILQSSATCSSVPSSSSSSACSLQQPVISHINAGNKNQKKRTRKARNQRILQSSLDNETVKHVTVSAPSTARAATVQASSVKNLPQKRPLLNNAISLAEAAVTTKPIVVKSPASSYEAKSASVITVKELEKAQISLKTERKYASNMPENQLKTFNKNHVPAEPRLLESGKCDDEDARKSSITSISYTLSGVKLTEENAVVGLSNILSSNYIGGRTINSSSQQSSNVNSTKGK